ncbi:senescence-associated protein AAF, chlorolplastic isoform X1 [Vitis riparia]|uniref:senescence-associated protein AAF, chlorolplastic isoform X1 n=1 Tax=Vitis riparia TaxID=96939 RepID=UPI00155ADCE0|nr:senescence-associated protein AAF, chlorolplastic isoform X1 [Vitis riparia]
MALTASKFSSSPVATDRTSISKSRGTISSFSKSIKHCGLHSKNQGVELRRQSSGHLLTARYRFSNKGFWHICGKTGHYFSSRGSSVLCWLTGTHKTEAKQCVEHYSDCSDIPSVQLEDEEDENLVMPERIIHSNQGLAEACKFVYNDAKFVNERARNDMVLLSRGIMRLDARARQDVAILGSEFLKLDARAREDTEKIDHGVKKKAERLHHIATILKDKAQSRLKSAADKHWSDGALEADLRRADFCAKQRAMEDALMALEFVKNIHDMMVSKMYKLKKGTPSSNDTMGHIMLEKNGKTLDFFPGEVSTDRITAIQEVYLSMASALSEADGIDYTDPEELELLVTTLIDLDAMDGKSSVSLLAECSSSPDVNTRQALANALAAAPSMWTLGNAGMGALQRLAEDSNPAIAVAASKAIYELKKQWEIEEGDSWRFTMNQKLMKEADDVEDTD